MNLNQLEYFVAVAESLNFTKAAERCFISQTAMTQQIKALENKIGVELFVRDKHHVSLTAAGKIYLNEARIILDRSNEAMRLARLASEGIQGELTIGYIRGYGQSDFSNIIRNFKVAYPGIKVNFIRDNMNGLLDKLYRKECDLVFSILPSEERADYERMFLKSYPVMAVVPAGHKLAGLDTCTYKDLEDEEFIMMQPGNRPTEQMEESMLIHARGGYFPKVVGLEGDPETLLLMISVGIGISLLPEYITRGYQKDLNLKIIPVLKENGEEELINVGIYYNSKNNNPAVVPLFELIKNDN